MKVQEYSDNKGVYFFFCPGCQEYHSVHVGRPNAFGDQYAFNGDSESPTFTPIVKRSIEQRNRSKHGNYAYHRCYAIVEQGQIAFTAACTHPFAGREMEMIILKPKTV